MAFSPTDNGCTDEERAAAAMAITLVGCGVKITNITMPGTVMLFQ